MLTIVSLPCKDTLTQLQTLSVNKAFSLDSKVYRSNQVYSELLVFSHLLENLGFRFQ